MNKTFFYYNKWGIATSVAILFLLLMPTKPFIQDSPILEFDKLVHMGIFGTLTLICTKELSNWFSQLKQSYNAVLIAAIYATCLGVLMEVLQSLTNIGRSFEWYDIAADAMGALVAFVFVKLRGKSR